MAPASESLLGFLEFARANADLQLYLMGIGTAEEACTIARDHGFEISADDFTIWRDGRVAELEDEELQPSELSAVVGGVSLSPTTSTLSSSLKLSFLPGDMFIFLRMLR
jgi:predicted ribosomally synthesized peptide with nif11-like leader